MKIDQMFINDVKLSLDENKISRKDAKQQIASYAKESFNLELNKQKSLDNMIKDIEDFIVSYTEESLPDQVGLSITDMIEAADQVSGTSIFNEAKPEALNLVKSTSLEHQDERLEDTVQEPVESIKHPETVPEHQQERLDTQPVKEPQDKDSSKDKPKTKDLKQKEFFPEISLLGDKPGYYTCPWWIFDWISTTPDWKNKLSEFPYTHSINIVKSLIYYINKNGSVDIRETRNSKFYTLT